MNPSSNNLAHIALLTAAVAVGIGIFFNGPQVYRLAARGLDLLTTSTSSMTTTVSTERFAELQASAAAYDRLRRRLAVTADDNRVATGSTPTTYMRAAVIGRPPQSPYDTLVIDVGAQAGVELEDVAWWPPGVYLGEVVKVRQHTAVVRLVSAPGTEHAVIIDETVPVTVTGQGGDALYTEIPQALAVEVGATVVSDSLGLPIGVVAATQSLSARNMQALHISRFAPSQVIEHVYVGN